MQLSDSWRSGSMRLALGAMLIWFVTVSLNSDLDMETTALAHEESPSDFNYYEHVRPILAEHCGGCHRAGGVGPMSLLQYEDTLPWANAIKLQLLEETMPPWLPDETSTAFRHARSLTPDELNIVVDWAVGQTPEGVPTEVTFPDPNESGLDSDVLVLQPAEPVVLGEDDYELDACIVLPVGNESPRTLSEAKFLPGEGRPILRRVVAVQGESCDPAARPIFTWLPDRAVVSIVGGGEQLDAGSKIALSVLYRKGWREEGETIRDLPRLVLRLSDSDDKLTARHVTESVVQFDSPHTLAAIYPMPSSETGSFQIAVEFPTGDKRLLLSIEQYQPDWQDWREEYVLETPLSLPPGARITLNQPSAWLYFVSSATASADAP